MKVLKEFTVEKKSPRSVCDWDMVLDGTCREFEPKDMGGLTPIQFVNRVRSMAKLKLLNVDARYVRDKKGKPVGVQVLASPMTDEEKKEQRKRNEERKERQRERARERRSGETETDTKE